MIHRTFRFATVIALAVLFAAVAAGQKSKAKSMSQSEGKTVTGSGCVEAGVEAGCLILKDTHTGTLYNLFFKDNPPAVNTAIHFTGKEHQGPTTCMQGTPVDVTKFTVLKMQCPGASSRKKKK